jgi:hypothetical protein
MKELKAFHGSPEIKAKYLARVRQHREADELIKGQYWQHGKGCAVGCTLEERYNEDKHMAYETDLGIPVALARLEDSIFEGLQDSEAQLWPERFLSAIQPGADLSGVADKFLLALLADEQHGVWRHADDLGKQVIEAVAVLLRRKIAGATVTAAEWNAAARAADHAANSVAYAASYAVRAARASYAAAYADSAAYAASYVAYAARAARAAHAAARIWQADVLIAQLQAA